MEVVATRELGDGQGEERTITVSVDGDGRVMVEEASGGDVTELAFGHRRRRVTLSFAPVDGYGLEDALAILGRPGGDVYISDFSDSMDLFGVPYARDEALL